VQGTGAADSYSTFWTSATGGYYFLGSQMVAFSGVTALRFEGSGGADTINCGSGADIVADGGGGDNVNLGAGNDTLIFDNLLDGDVYNGGAGIDTFDWSGIVTSVDYTINLTAGNWSYLASSETVTGFENIKGADQTGVSKETLIGNALVNQIFGNGGNDIINGMAGADLLNGGAGGDFLVGGLGSDKMTGGAANDVFQYNSIGERGDIITDYSNVAGNNDTFRISAAGFGGGLVAGGVLAASQFQIRADNVAQDANDRFIFRTTDKTLWFDANGSAAGGLFMVADLQASATMSAADIVIF
jgi:Ca2+-binding RTX toxin-like protein